MGDRRSSFSFRFWNPPAAHRPPATQTGSPTQRNTTTPASAPNPPRAVPQPPIQTPPNVANPTLTTPSSAENQEPAGQSVTETETTTPETTKTTSTRPTDEPQSSSPSRATPQSPLASPSRKTPQSRSPPQPSSPARGGIQARSTPSSPSRLGSETPKSQRGPQPRSPSRLLPRSPKQIPSPAAKTVAPTSPSKESRRSIEDNSNSHGVDEEKGPNLEEKETLEPQVKEEVKSHNDNNDLNGQTADGASKKENEGPTTPPPSQNLDKLSTSDIEKEPNAKPDEIGEVKEVVKSTNPEANEGKNKADEFLEQKSKAQATEKEDIPKKSEKMHGKTNESEDTNTKQTPKRNTQNKNGENLHFHKDIQDDISSFVNRIGTGDPIHDRNVNVITLAGENRGASMQMGLNSTKGEKPVHIHRGYKTKPEESTDGEGSSQKNKQENANGKEEQPTEAYVNNNAQGINNSIVFHSSVTEGNPGVHMVINLVPKEKTMESTEKARPEARKAEFSTTRAEKLTYEPVVRRRCLRGLLLEPSDSDPEKPEKPRRHGCLVACKKSGEENNIDVL